jgi:hypothetical protein
MGILFLALFQFRQKECCLRLTNVLRAIMAGFLGLYHIWALVTGFAVIVSLGRGNQAVPSRAVAGLFIFDILLRWVDQSFARR